MSGVPAPPAGCDPAREGGGGVGGVTPQVWWLCRMTAPKPKLCMSCGLTRTRGQRSREAEEAAACCDVGGDIVPKQRPAVRRRVCVCVHVCVRRQPPVKAGGGGVASDAVGGLVWLARPQRQPRRQRRRAVAARSREAEAAERPMKIGLVRWTVLRGGGVARQRGRHGVVVESVIEGRESWEADVMRMRVVER